MRALLAVGIVALLAGCGGRTPDGDPAAPSSGPPGAEGLHGIVLDPAVRPLAGALVRLAPVGANATTDGQGRYAFPDAPRETPLVVTASLAGFVAASRQVSLPPQGDVELDLVLAPTPSDAGYADVLKFDGLIGCQAAVVLSEQVTQPVDCGSSVDEGSTVWAFSAAPGLSTAVIEVAWTPGSPLADGLGARLEQTGADAMVLAEKVGRSPLRLVVPQQTAAQRFAPAGGNLQLTVYAMPITDEDEQAAAAAVAVQQPFQAFASLFYRMTPPPTYSFVNATSG